LHLEDCTLAFGPLNFINLFQFEELNRIWVSFLHGFDLIGEEIFKIFLTARTPLFYSDCIKNFQIYKNYILKNLQFKSSYKKRWHHNHNHVCVKNWTKLKLQTTNSIGIY
jgi:hypothetical protein